MSYINILKNTLANYFRAEEHTSIVGRLRTEEVMFTDKRFLNKSAEERGDRLDCTDRTLNLDRINKCINYKEIETINLIEEHEYSKAYKYVAIFEYSNFDENKIDELSTKNLITMWGETQDNCCIVIDHPTYRKWESKHIFKFSLLRESNLLEDTEVGPIKYSVLAIIHTDVKAFEIRLDNLQSKYRSGEDFYGAQVRSAREWSHRNLDLQITNINFRSTIERIRKECTADIVVWMQYMNTLTNASVKLVAGDGGEPILPLLGELKKLINDNSDTFDKEQDAKKLLTDFIDYIEQTSDLPRVALLWIKENYLVEFVHEYKNNDFCLMLYRGREQKMRRMDDVTRFIMQHRKSTESEE